MATALDIRYVTGDATVPQDLDHNTIIAHIVNNYGGWGAGFVVPLAKLYPKAEQYYREWAQNGSVRNFACRTDHSLELGYNQFVTVLPNICVANMCAQNGYVSADNPVAVDYKALTRCMIDVIFRARLYAATIQMPRIGCGLGGGKWELVVEAMENAWRMTGCVDAKILVVDLP